jgi:hypothetical protein
VNFSLKLIFDYLLALQILYKSFDLCVFYCCKKAVKINLEKKFTLQTPIIFASFKEITIFRNIFLGHNFWIAVDRSSVYLSIKTILKLTYIISLSIVDFIYDPPVSNHIIYSKSLKKIKVNGKKCQWQWSYFLYLII